jgi:hypothetical protein
MTSPFSGSPWTRWPRTGLAIVAVTALLTAACSGSSSAGGSGGSPAARGSASPSAGSGGSPAAGASPAVGTRISPQRQLAFSECMRAHGVPGVPTSFPAPVPGNPPSTGNFKPAQANGPNPGSPQWNAAQQACRSLAPAPAKVPG